MTEPGEKKIIELEKGEIEEEPIQVEPIQVEPIQVEPIQEETVVEPIVEKEPTEEKEPAVEKEPATAANEITLKLGDIIIITDPTNEILNNNVFLIEYIDNTKIKLVNSETFEKTILPIDSNGVIGDGNIQSIKVISSNPEEGYARQNELLPGTWVNVYFGGDIPTVITGKITNLEEDMIEIRTTDGDTLFINFNYQGIPDDIPIETFEIRPAPPDAEKTVDADELVELGEEEQEQEQEEFYPRQAVKERIQTFFDLNDLDFGEAVKVTEYVNIDKEKYRYNIDAQTNDLLEEMISTIPNSKRTNNVLNSIHIMITRFLQLRQIASTFDANKNVNGIVKRTAEDRPLAEYLADFKNNLYWVMTVVKNVKKIYPYGSNPEYKRYNDYEYLDENSSLLEMETYFKNYRSNQSVEGQNKYSNLYYSLDPYLTPFYSVRPDEQTDVFSSSAGVIIEGDVQGDINAIIDNLGQLYSTVIGRSELINRKFVFQKYNLGLNKLYASNLKGPKLVAHRVKLTNNDPISINSIITLPEPTVRFSQINLPGSNLLVKANLNLHFLNYWELLKQKTVATPITIDGLDNELEYDDTNFVDNIKQYILDLSEYEKPPDLTNLDIYKIFLRTIIPKIRVLFSLVKKYIRGRLSLVDVVTYLEPFMIYPIDLTYMQYKEINNFILDKIKEYNRIYKEYNIAFSMIKYFKQPGQYDQHDPTELYTYSNPLFSLLATDLQNKDLPSNILDEYGFTNAYNMKLSPSEFLKRITVSDYGNLFNTAVALTNIPLMYPTSLSTVFDSDKDKLKQIMEKDQANDKCSTYIIAKKYYSSDSLTEDNNKPIYFDKEFDTTNYELIEDKYRKQRDQLSSEDFILFLTDEFKTKNKMDDASAEYMATTLVNQAKKVREGDYAVLVNSDNNMPDSMDYYVRKDDIWVLDKNIDPTTFIVDDDVLCNIKLACSYNTASKSDDKCDSIVVTRDTIVNNALKQIMDQFDKNYNISKEELNTQIKKHLVYFQQTYTRLQMVKRKQFFKYNDYQYDLGKDVMEQMKAQVVSPYAKLRNLILGQNDFVKKQTDIITFVSKFCRDGDPTVPNIHDGEMEDEWWLYCVETNTKLMPRFISILATTFITKNAEYDNVLNELKRQIGKLSDDGDAWVDEHSGEVICYIDFDMAEGYVDGFVDRSHAVVEQDIGDIILENQQQKQKQKEQLKQKKRLSPEGELASNVITGLSINMGIDIEHLRDFIIKVVTELMSDTTILKKEPVYRKLEEEAAKKGKKIPAYTTVYSTTLLYLTLGMYLIAIQTSVPSIKTRKTTPGCVRSFTGFPFEGEGDDSALNYVACVALKSRDTSTMPWNALPKSEEKIASTLKSFIIRYLLPYGEVEQKIKDKTEYILTNPEQDIPEEHELTKWQNFLPPLKRFTVQNLANVSDAFTQELHSELYNGNHRQLEKILVIESKIIAFSLAIQQDIQKIVEKKNLLLKGAGQLFMDNACCNERDKNELTTLQYFVQEDKNIEFYNSIVYNLTSLTKDIKTLTQSAIMLSEVNTKRSYPEISNEFSEETIYYAFIALCKFQSSVPLMEELASVCVDKPDYLNKMDTIQEKISKLKRDGRNYTKSQFLRLFQIVSRNNIIHMSLYNKETSCVSELKELLQHLDDANTEIVSKAFLQKMDNLVENADVQLEEDMPDMRILKNYLASTNEKMKKELLNFIKTKAKVNSLELKNITKFLNELTIWRFDEEQRNADIKISDDSLYNYINFFKNFISLFHVVFPNMIINNNIKKIEPPKYWGISIDHAEDIKSMVSSFYKPLMKFYGNTSIINVLNEIQGRTRPLYLLSLVTPVSSNMKIGEKTLYNVFEKRTATLLYEYYFLSILNEYIALSMDPAMIARMLVTPKTSDSESELFSSDFLVEQQLRFAEQEPDIIEGDAIKLKQEIAKLLVGYINIMMKSKKTMNVSYKDVEDRVFKLKEAEKYTFTDRLRDMSEEERSVDTILKHHKLGSLYSIGLSKGIREYDPENFDHDKKVAEKVAEIQNRLRRQGVTDRDMDIEMDDAMADMNVDRNIDMELAMDMNNTDDYNDGDPWGEELENEREYD